MSSLCATVAWFAHSQVPPQTYRPPTPTIPSARRPMSYVAPRQLESQTSLTHPFRMVSFFCFLLPPLFADYAPDHPVRPSFSDLPGPSVGYHAGFVSDPSAMLGTVPLYVRKHPPTTFREYPAKRPFGVVIVRRPHCCFVSRRNGFLVSPR